MDADLLAQDEDRIELKGSSIIAALKASAVEFILSVPDIVTSGGLLRPIARDRSFQLIRLCKENECLCIASSLAYYDKLAVALMQHPGLPDSIKAHSGLGVDVR